MKISRNLPISKNSTGVLIAPSGKITKHELLNAKQRIHHFCNIVYYDQTILQSHDYFAGTLERRKQEFEKAFQEGDIVWCVRGGYASMELLPMLNIKSLKNKNASFIGSSDITPLLLFLYSKSYKGMLIHGPMPGSTLWPTQTNLLKAILNNNTYFHRIPLPQSVRSFDGPITGGNLRVITHLIGTSYEPNFDNHVLFLEDVRERPAAIYTMLEHLLQSGKLNKIKALLIGRFHECGDYKKLLTLFLKKITVPNITELPLGHCSDMIPIRYGDYVQYKNGLLTFEKQNTINN